MLRPIHILALGSAIAVCGCVPPPSAPGVLALPSANKDFQTFQAEDIACRTSSSAAIGVPPPGPNTPAPPPVSPGVAANLQAQYDAAYTQCMYSKGDKVVAVPEAPGYYTAYPYYGYYSPYYYGPGFVGGPYLAFGYGFRGGYYGGYRGGYHGGYRR